MELAEALGIAVAHVLRKTAECRVEADTEGAGFHVRDMAGRVWAYAYGTAPDEGMAADVEPPTLLDTPAAPGCLQPR